MRGEVEDWASMGVTSKAARASQVSCFFAYTRVFLAMRAMVVGRSSVPSKWLNHSLKPTVLSALRCRSGYMRLASCSIPSATICCTRALMRSNSCGRGMVRAKVCACSGGAVGRPVRWLLYGRPACRLTSMACIMRRVLAGSTVARYCGSSVASRSRRYCSPCRWYRSSTCVRISSVMVGISSMPCSSACRYIILPPQMMT